MGKRTRRSKKGVNGSQQSEQRDPSGPNGNLKVGELYVLDGQLVRLKRRAAHGRVEVLDEMNGIHHFPFPGELRPRDFKSNEDKSATIECAVLTEEQQGKKPRSMGDHQANHRSDRSRQNSRSSGCKEGRPLGTHGLSLAARIRGEWRHRIIGARSTGDA